MSRPLYLMESALGTYWTGGRKGTRVGLDVVAKKKSLTLPEIELQSFSPQPCQYTDRVIPPPLQ
jgi:hypothetical protein